MATINIREGKIEDLPRVLELVKELAIYERAPEKVTNTVSRMQEEGFGENPAFGMFVAERDNYIVGIAVYYFRYSTWKGKRLFLEDIIVTENERGKGLGKLLFEKTMHAALKTNCSGMTWQVLDWNEPAINFYRKYGAQFDDEWINCSIESAEIKQILAG